MITTIKRSYYWSELKIDIAEFISKCIECQQVNIEFRNPMGLLQPIPIPECKWEVISMGFIIGFPRTSKKYDVIMVMVDKLSKEAQFIVFKSK